MLSKNTRVDRFLLYKYRYGISMVILVVATVFLLTYKLGYLVGGISTPEATQGLSSLYLSEILANPVYAPYKILQWLSIQVFDQTVIALRLPSIIFAAASVALLYDVFRHWHKQRIAILGSMFFVTSSWILHVARLGTASISLTFFVIALLWAATRLHHAPVRRWPFLLMSLAVALALYTPFMLYFLIAGIALHRFAVKKYFWHLNKRERLVGALILLVVIGPLIWAFVKDPNLLRLYFGIPENLPSITQYLRNIQDTIGFIFWRSTINPVYHLSTLPMLDIFTATMAALGVYQYEKQLNQHRTKWLFIGSLILILTLAFGAATENFAVMAPLVYIFAATGVVTLLVQWYEIFPKNPVARTIGLIPIIMLLLVVTAYHSNRYFIAWARAPETREAFNLDTTSLRNAVKQNPVDQVVVVAPIEHHETLRFSLGGITRSVVIMTPEEFNDTNIQANHTYVHAEAQISMDKKKQMEFDGYVTTPREFNSVAYLRFVGPWADINA